MLLSRSLFSVVMSRLVIELSNIYTEELSRSQASLIEIKLENKKVKMRNGNNERQKS